MGHLVIAGHSECGKGLEKTLVQRSRVYETAYEATGSLLISAV